MIREDGKPRARALFLSNPTRTGAARLGDDAGEVHEDAEYQDDTGPLVRHLPRPCPFEAFPRRAHPGQEPGGRRPAALHLDDKAELGDDKLKNLYTLEASNKDIRDLTGLEKCPNLASLRLDKGQVSDLKPLKDLANLQSLDLAANKVSDLTPVAGLSKLQYLNLADNQVTKLEPLAGLAALSALDLSGNQVTDLGPLGNIPRLASLYLARNQIVDIGPLASYRDSSRSTSPTTRSRISAR